MHFWSPSDPSQTTATGAKPRYDYSNLNPNGQSSKIPVRQLLSEAKPSYVHILHFKATWSEYQKPCHTATERGDAKLRILDFKTKWSEF